MASRWTTLIIALWLLGLAGFAGPFEATLLAAPKKKAHPTTSASKAKPGVSKMPHPKGAKGASKAKGKGKGKGKGKAEGKATPTPAGGKAGKATGKAAPKADAKAKDVPGDAKASGKGDAKTSGKGDPKGKKPGVKGRRGGDDDGVRDGLNLVHRVRKGDSLWTIARKYGVTVAELRRINGEKKRRSLRVGQSVIIKVRDPKTVRELRPYLKDWGRLEPGTGYVVKRPDKNYGRPWAIALVRQAIADLHERYPSSTDVFVGDFSGVMGGRIQHHLSHQTGRDVDLAYFLKGNPSVDDFVEVTPETVDVEKSWQLLESCLRTGRVKFAFMDYGLQPLFRAHAESLGYPPDDLDELFQYPREVTVREGVIRHVKGHADHLHVRFSCPPGDAYCK